MLNAGYNLPSEDCNTEKQMVFHSNKLLCVYSVYGAGFQSLLPSKKNSPDSSSGERKRKPGEVKERLGLPGVEEHSESS